MSEDAATQATAPTSPTSGQRAVKAVIPAAGLATRFLPATKAVPKELLPVVDRPVLQYIVEEAAAAGIRDVLLVTGRGKTGDGRPLRPPALPGGPAARRRATWSGWPRCGARANSPRSTPAGRASRSGSGHAVSYAESHVGGEPFAVLLGDEFVDEDEPLLPAMLDLQARTGGIVLALHRGRAGRGQAGTASPRSSRPMTTLDDQAEIVPGDRPGGEADAGGGAEQPRRDRPVRAAADASSMRSGASSRAAVARSS